MHVSVVIPTFDRNKMLRRTVMSVLASTYKDLSIIIVVDGNRNVLPLANSLKAEVLFNDKRMDWVWSMNRALQHIEGSAVVYASDDLEFERQCIEKAAARLLLKVPDTDGVVAITQDVKGCSTAFGMLGHKFIERFPGRRVFCPDYIHYGSDSELGRFARSIGRLYMCDEARVVHHRPKDSTYKRAKPVEKRDLGFQRLRVGDGLLWGKDFKLLSKRGYNAVA